MLNKNDYALNWVSFMKDMLSKRKRKLIKRKSKPNKNIEYLFKREDI